MRRIRIRLRRLRDRAIGELDVAAYVRRGLQVGKRVHIGPGTRLDPSHCWLIRIEDDATLSPNVMVLAHDGSLVKQLGVNYVAPVCIGKRAFIGANAIIMPGVSIGEDAVVAAGAVVTKHIRAGRVAVGVPAREVGDVSTYVEKHRARMAFLPCYPLRGWSVEGGITREGKRQQLDAVADGGYVEAVRGQAGLHGQSR